MSTPRAFYHIETKGDAYTHQSTGEFVVERFLKGQTEWRQPEKGIETKKKTLLLTDWTAANWSNVRCGQIISALNNLLDEGFEIYLWQGDQYKLVTAENIYLIYLNEMRQCITELNQNELTAAAIKQLNTTKDKIHFLDHYWVNLLCNETLLNQHEGGDIPPHEWDINDVFDRRLNEIYETIAEMENCNFTQTIFSMRENKLAKSLKLNNSKVTANFQIAELNNHAAENLLANIAFEDIAHNVTIQPAILEQLQGANLVQVNPETFNAIINKMPGVTHLKYSCPKNCDISETVIREVPSLMWLETLDTKFRNNDQHAYLYKILDACTDLKKLELSLSNINEDDLMGFCSNLYIDHLPVNIEILKLAGVKLTNEDLLKIQDRCKKLKALELKDCDLQQLRYIDYVNMRSSLTNLTLSRKGDFMITDFNESSFDAQPIFNLLTGLKSLHMKNFEIECLYFGGNGNHCHNLESIHIENDALFSHENVDILINYFPGFNRLIVDETAEKSYRGDFKESSPELLEEDDEDERRNLKMMLKEHQISLVKTKKALARLKSSTEDMLPELQDPLSRSFDPEDALDFKPADANFDFKFQGKTDARNQNMIVDKICQYLTLKNQYLELIPQMNKGMCFALSDIFTELNLNHWDELISNIHAWDGKIDTLTANIESNITLIIKKYVDKRIHGKSELPQLNIYIGNNLDALFALQPSTLRLANPWHEIAIKYINKDNWLVYDPNYINGYLSVKTSKLKALVTKSLGGIILADNRFSDIGPVIFDINKFVKDGGLLILGYISNLEKVRESLKKGHKFNEDALTGLRLRNVNGIPAWVLGLCHRDPALSNYTLTLLLRLAKLNPDEYIDDLTKSVSELSAYHRFIVNERLIEILKASSNNTFVQNLVESLSSAMHHKTRQQYYKHALSTWNNNSDRFESTKQYLQRLTKPDEHKKHLIELNHSKNLRALQLALHAYCLQTGRPVFYVNSPLDLITSAPVVVRQGNHGAIKPPPGGPLHDFLKMHHDTANPAVIIINYENFKADDIVRFNGLLDNHRHADNTELPTSTLVIGLTNINHVNYYDGSDFYSRFDKKETCHLSEEQLRASIKPLPFVELEQSQPTARINLCHAKDWQERLLGRWVLRGDLLTFKEGELTAALKQGECIEIQNGLWEDPEFTHFWEMACINGYVDSAGAQINIPHNLRILKSDGYHESMGLYLSNNEGYIQSLEAIYLNPTLYNKFFVNYSCDNQNRKLITLPGFIEQNAGKKLDVNITRDLSANQWAALLIECQKFNVTLDIHTSDCDDVLPTAWTEDDVESTCIISSTDVNLTVTKLTGNQEKWQIIDVSECEASDLLTKLSGILTNELRFEFTETKQAVVRALECGQNIVLKGQFSPELADLINPILLDRRSNINIQSKFVIVTNNVNDFAIQPIYQHNVSSQEKKNELVKKFRVVEVDNILNDHPEESFSQLHARLIYLAARTTATNQSPWQGIDSCTYESQTHEPDMENYQTRADIFTDERLTAVNSILSHQPYVYLTGLTGVGKTTFVEKSLNSMPGVRILYQGINNLTTWANDQSDQLKILFIDESNIGKRQWSEFEGLFNHSPGILINGVYHNLTHQHKIVFAGNPLNYGGERTHSSFFEEHGNAVIFEPMPEEFIYAYILKPIFANTTLESISPDISKVILKVYRFLCDCSKSEILISPRELQMIALLVVSHLSANPEQNVIDITRHYSYVIGKSLAPVDDQIDFDRIFANDTLLTSNLNTIFMNNNNYLVTKSREPVIIHIQNLINLRDQRRSDSILLNEAQTYGGLGGIIIEGEPGIGKSEMVIDVLLKCGFVKGSITNTTNPDRVYYHIPVSMQIDEKIALIIRAFNEGNMVIMDEINSSPMMENLLNHLLMGRTPDGNRPLRPGFLIIGTQNPVTMAGRQAISTALARRMTTITLPSYTKPEMIEILTHRGIPRDEVEVMVNIYNKMSYQAKDKQLSPPPTFRDLLRLADQIIKAREQPLELLHATLKDDQNNHALAHALITKRNSIVIRHFQKQKQYETLISPNTSVLQRSLFMLTNVQNYDIDTCMKVLLSGVEVNLNITDATGTSLLHYACLTGNYIFVDTLLNRGVNITSLNNQGLSAHDFALKGENFDIMHLLALTEQITQMEDIIDGRLTTNDSDESNASSILKRVGREGESSTGMAHHPGFFTVQGKPDSAANLSAEVIAKEDSSSKKHKK